MPCANKPAGPAPPSRPAVRRPTRPARGMSGLWIQQVFSASKIEGGGSTTFEAERSINIIFYPRHSTSKIKEIPIYIFRPRRWQNPSIFGIRIRRSVESKSSKPKSEQTTCGSERGGARRDGGARRERAGRDADASILPGDNCLSFSKLNYKKMSFWACLWKPEQTILI